MLDEGHDANELPLRGVVVCSTSLSQELRALLTELSEHMGAIHRLDLTADVTHLIVGNIDTPKYKHTAKERPDIRVLKPEWIHAIRQAWREDQDLDVEALVQEYRLPAFYNLHVCVTGFEDIDQRQELIQTIQDNGAVYKGDLTRDVTHLIVAKAKGAKYERAKAWNLKIVSLKWLQESLERGMALDESLYHPLMPSEDQGMGAFFRGDQKTQMLGKRQREETAALTKEEAGKRKLRRTASTRLGGHSQNLLADISFAEDDTRLVNPDQWNDTTSGAADPVPSRTGTPLLSRADMSRHASRDPTPLIEQERGLFSGILCFAYGHHAKKVAKINEIITTNGGHLAQNTEDLSAALENNIHERVVLVLPGEWTAPKKQDVPVVSEGTWLVTEAWLERCIEQKRVVDPHEDVLSRPTLQLPIEGFRDISIATSGMGNDVMHIAKVVRKAGAVYVEELTQRTSVLVIPNLSAKPEKLAYAAKHKIPVVSEKWLLDSISQAQKLPLTEYALSDASRSRLPSENLDRPHSREGSHASKRETRKDDPRAQRLSAIRKRNLAPALPLIKSHSFRPLSHPKAKAPRKGPFIEEDAASEDEHSSAPQRLQNVHNTNAQSDATDETFMEPPPDDPPPSYPLQDLPPEMNSARQQSMDSLSIQGDARPVSPVKSATARDILDNREMPLDHENSDAPNMEESMAKNARLHGDIKSLLERQQSAIAPVEPIPKGKWRKGRPLGRATSMTSNSSAAVSFHQSTGIDNGLDTALSPYLEELGAPMPSQQLSYETPDAQEYRVKMSKKMGTRLTDDSLGTRVESPGMVRDVDTSSSNGVGSRVRGRHRSVKN